MKVFILEDDMNRMKFFFHIFRNHDVFHFDNVKPAFKWMLENNPDILFLDHDLGGKQNVDSKEDNTGSSFTRMLKKSEIKVKQAVIHSLNPVGADEMKHNLGYVCQNIEIVPFSRLIKELGVF